MKNTLLATLGTVALLSSCSIDTIPVSRRSQHLYPISYNAEVDSSVTENLRAITTYARLSTFQRKKWDKSELLNIYEKNPLSFESFVGMEVKNTHYVVYTQPQNYPYQTLMIKINLDKQERPDKKVKYIEFIDKDADGTVDFAFLNGKEACTPHQLNYEGLLETLANYLDTQGKSQTYTDTYLKSDSLLTQQ